MIAGKQIRQKVAGVEHSYVIASENGFSLEHKITYKGWFDEAFSVDSFILTKGNEFLSSWATLDEALTAWDRLGITSSYGYTASWQK